MARSTRDGSSPERAIIVRSIGEEYEWLARHCPGFTLVQQRLVDIAGRPYDIMALQSEETGEEREVHFDISSFFGTTSRNETVH